jgi:hypothetical protein
MKYYFKLIVALLAGACLVSAAANQDGGAHRAWELSYGNYRRLELYAMYSDNSAPLARQMAVSGGYSHFAYNDNLFSLFTCMIRYRKQDLLRWILPLVDFGREAALRDEALSALLRTAIRYGNMEIAELLVDQEGFRVQPSWMREWMNSRERLWDAGAVKAFISRHGEHADALAPGPTEMRKVHRLEDAQALVEVAQLCDHLSGQHTFDPRAFLVEFVFHPGEFADHEDQARVIHMLTQHGAQLSAGLRMSIPPKVTQLLDEWSENIKEPGCH